MKSKDNPNRLVARISYGYRVRVPDEILDHMKLKIGDLLGFEFQPDGSVKLFAAEVRIRDQEASVDGS
jgi:bifunctional DNA-binding transcriptional regulator/antitoxin component of YhaV-PrlF toxin-antitoxin module